MHLMADFGTHGACTSSVHETTCMAMVPVLVSILLVSHCERTQLVVERLSLLGEREGRERGRERDKIDR